mmetsp:Transcript_26216/g.42797  ORF Transcript_26216/g.42797 Transcript_26216/m.42797 type:complete len:449 (+) Transcript_26216:69-1415(+)
MAHKTKPNALIDTNVTPVLTTRMLQFGESRSETGKPAIISLCCLMLLAFFFAHKGWGLLWHHLKNHSNSPRTPLEHRMPPKAYMAASVTCVCQLVANMVMFLAVTGALVQATIGSTKEDPFKNFFQESQVLANTLTALAVSTFFLEKARQVGLILQGREYFVANNALYVLKVLIISSTLHSRISLYMYGGTTATATSTTIILFCGLLCSAIFATTGAFIQIKLQKRALRADGTSNVFGSSQASTRSVTAGLAHQQTSRVNRLPSRASARRVGKFAQSYGTVMVLVLGSTMGLHHVEKYPNMYEPLDSHLLFCSQSLGLILLSHLVYSFLFPNVRVPGVCCCGKAIHQHAQTTLNARHQRPARTARQRVYVTAQHVVGTRQTLTNRLPIRGVDVNSHQSSSLVGQRFVSSSSHQGSSQISKSTLIGQRFVPSVYSTSGLWSSSGQRKNS